MNLRIKGAVAASAAALLALSACGGGEAAGDSSETIDLVAYSTPQTAYQAIEEHFKDTDAGAEVSFKESYGPSGDQSRAVAGGQPADYVNFSLEGDVTRLVDEGLVAEDWNAGPNKGIVANSVVAIVVREGNPKNIEGWDDLIKPGVGIVTPNPGSSGGARWNILAAWGHVIANGGTEDDAKEYLTKFFENTVSLPGSARDALTAFTGGNGDVLISYENEAILARQNGEALDYIVPDETLLIETPGAVTTDAGPAAQDFLDFVLTPEAQAEFVKAGYRSVVGEISEEVQEPNDPADPFPTPNVLLTVRTDFGGWPAAAEKFFTEDTGIVPQIQAETGKTE